MFLLIKLNYFLQSLSQQRQEGSNLEKCLVSVATLVTASPQRRLSSPTEIVKR